MANIPSDKPALKFPDLPLFYPHYTPKEVLEFGAFDGKFFNKISYREHVGESLFEGLDPNKYENTLQTYNQGAEPIEGGILTPNYFGLSVPTRHRQQRIPDYIRFRDPMGWFQWYARFFTGRRNSQIDPYRVQQWRNEICTLFFYIKGGTPEGELQEGTTKITDLNQFKDVRQQLLHFGWDSTVDPASMEIYL